MKAILIRDFYLNLRSGSGVLNGLLFFLVFIVIIPFGIGPDIKLLSKIAPALLWIGTLLAALLSFDRLFQLDHEDGSLEGMIINLDTIDLTLIVIAKAISQWFFSCLPLIVATPVFGLILNMEQRLIANVVLTLVIGTPALVSIGALGAAITLNIPRGSFLLATLIFPLIIPILIFGVIASHEFLSKEWLILGGLSLFLTVLGTFGAALTLKVQHV
jgi:heme exporter protein B